MHAGGTSEGEWRSPTDTEASCLHAIVSQTDLELLEQLDGLRVRPGCLCGCGTLDLAPAGAQVQGKSPRAQAPGVIDVVDDDGEVVGGIILFLDRGSLSTLEIYSFDDEPLQIPLPEHLRFGQT